MQKIIKLIKYNQSNISACPKVTISPKVGSIPQVDALITYQLISIVTSIEVG